MLIVLVPTVVCAADGEAPVIQHIEKLGGKVDRDEKANGRPVRGVNLSRRDVTDGDLKPLAALKHPQTLDLSFCNKLTDAGLKELPACKKLTSLRLASCELLTDAGLKELADCKQLTALDLRQCGGVTDEGITTLKKALPNLQVHRKED